MMRMAAVAVVALCVGLTGCTKVIDTSKPQAEPPVAPITAGQVNDLLSEDAQKGDDGNLFVTVDPDKCAGVAREVDPPFLFDHHPAAHDGGHWDSQEGHEAYVEEMVAVYRADFDPGDAIDEAKRTIESCRDTPFTITAMDGDSIEFRMVPNAESSDPEIVLWSFQAPSWACDNAFIAAHNAAIEITTCGPVNGFDVKTVAEDALKRIEKLANTTL
jgi:hypothetical protein